MKLMADSDALKAALILNEFEEMSAPCSLANVVLQVCHVELSAPNDTD